MMYKKPIHRCRDDLGTRTDILASSQEISTKLVAVQVYYDSLFVSLLLHADICTSRSIQDLEHGPTEIMEYRHLKPIGYLRIPT